MTLTNARPKRQCATPLFIDRLEQSGSARALEPIALAGGDVGASQHDEGWLQKLIFRYPNVLPVDEIEPGISGLISVCLELPTSAGSVDNLYVTDRGNLVIAECKLWRNPEARREVVAQIIDYAHSMAAWTYANLETAIRKAATADGSKPPASLFELVEKSNEMQEADFVDTVSRNLRLGRMLLLIVGDGIREGVESLTEFLQMHAGFHFTLGIIEMPVYRLPEKGYIVQPRVLARTVNIERGIVRIVDRQAIVEPPADEEVKNVAARRTSISQDALFEKLAEIEPELPKAIQHFLGRAAELGVVLEMASRSLQIRWRGPDDRSFALSGINEAGGLITYSVNWAAESIGRIDLAHEYLEKIASLIGATVRRTATPSQWYLVVEGTKAPKAMALLARPDDWLAIVESYVEKLKAVTIEKRDS